MAMTPAMAAELTDRLWGWEELVEMMDADQPAKKRGPYGPIIYSIYTHCCPS